MISEYQAQREHLKVRGTNFTAATNWWVALSSTTPNRDGTGITEPTTGSYARVSTTANTTDWVAGATINLIQNAFQIPFVTASANWLSGATLTWGLIFDAVTAGNFLFAGALSTPQAVLSGNTFSIPAAGLVISRL